MIRIGIIGTGRIARRFVPEALCVNGVQITAVYNPHEGSAERFVREVCGDEAVEACGSLDEFWSYIDAAYIASPHETHVGYIKESLAHGKHVLCEKPMVLGKAEAEDCFRLADEKGLVLMEGVKTAYCPGYHKVIEQAKSGIIGDIKYIDSCFTKLEDENSRELNDTEYGGSFTELGSYVMLTVFDLIEDIGEPLFTSLCDSKGIDLFTRFDAKGMYGIASAECGLGVKAEGRLLISGTKGFIKVAAPWWKTRHIEIHFEDESKSISLDEPFEGDGLRYEISEFMQQIENGGRVTNYAPKDRSVFMADMMERFLRKRTESGVSSK